MSILAERLLAVHQSLSQASLPHAFGGAIALAYCTEEPRGTRDLDVNVFARPQRAAEVLGALPGAVAVSDDDIDAARRDGQVRVWWQETPIDVFLDTHAFHRQIASGVREVPFSGQLIPVLGCTALVVLKALFDRTKDWADIEAIVEAGSADTDEALGWVKRLLGPDDATADRLATLIA